MMGRAYAYMDDPQAPQPIEEEWSHYIKRFGVQAVFGRPMSVGELRRLNLYERVKNAYLSRSQAQNMATWAKEHPTDNALLERALLERNEQQG